MKNTSLLLVFCLSTLCSGHLPADFNHDKIVDFSDFALFAKQWLCQGVGGLSMVIVAPATATEEQKQLADYVCDGTDDHVQINDAINAVAEASGRKIGDVGWGGEVYLLPGQYNTTDRINLKTRVSLKGTGDLHTVKIMVSYVVDYGIYYQAQDSANSDISVEEKGQFELDNLLIAASRTGGTEWCIYIDDDDVLYIHDCIFTNIYTSGGNSGGMYIKKSWASEFYSCTFEHSGGIGLYEANSTNSNHFSSFFADNNGAGYRGDILFYCTFVGCGASKNGLSGGGSGFRIAHEEANSCWFLGCYSTYNYHSGFYVSSGEWINFIGCRAQKNNRDEQWDRAGFRIGGNNVNSCTLINCQSTFNDGENSNSEDNEGSGFLIYGDNTQLINCISQQNTYGVTIMDTASGTKCNVHFAGGDTQEFYYLGGTSNSIGPTCVDNYINVAAADTDGIKANIIDTTPVTTFDCQPDYPRNITITGDAGSDGKVKIEGITADGKVFDTSLSDEEITVIAGATVQGDIAWAKITKITRTTSNGSIDIGWGDRLGLSNMIRAVSDVYKFVYNGSDETIPTVNDNYATVDCSLINDGDDFIIYYKAF